MIVAIANERSASVPKSVPLDTAPLTQSYAQLYYEQYQTFSDKALRLSKNRGQKSLKRGRSIFFRLSFVLASTLTYNWVTGMRFLKEKTVYCKRSRFIVNMKHCKESQGKDKALVRKTHTIHYGRRFPVQIELKQRRFLATPSAECGLFCIINFRPNFRADGPYESRDAQQYKSGSVKAY